MNKLYYAFMPVFKKDSVSYQMAGKCALINNQFKILEDYFGLIDSVFKDCEPDKVTERLENFKDNPYLKVLSANELKDSDIVLPMSKLEIPDIKDGKVDRSVFEYHRAGMDKPHILEADGWEVKLDGQKLEPEEIEHIHNNVRNGAATLKRKSQLKINKAEISIENLIKNEANGGQITKVNDYPEFKMYGGDELETQHQLMNTNVDLGMNGETNSLLYLDSRGSNVGNCYSYESAKKYLEENPGVYNIVVAVNINDAECINNRFGFTVGDKALRMYCDILGKNYAEITGGMAIDNNFGFVPHGLGIYKLGRGDFIAFFKHCEQAELFIHNVSKPLSLIESMEGNNCEPDNAYMDSKHCFTACFGIGKDIDAAKESLGIARQNKEKHLMQENYSLGQSPCFAYSSITGRDGALGVDKYLLPQGKPSESLLDHEDIERYSFLNHPATKPAL